MNISKKKTRKNTFYLLFKDITFTKEEKRSKES